jgi:hypothetical protein
MLYGSSAKAATRQQRVVGLGGRRVFRWVVIYQRNFTLPATLRASPKLQSETLRSIVLVFKDVCFDHVVRTERVSTLNRGVCHHRIMSGIVGSRAEKFSFSVTAVTTSVGFHLTR